MVEEVIMTSNTTYYEWNTFSNGKNDYDSEQDNIRDYEYFALNSHYTYEFDSTEHKLDADLMLFTSFCLKSGSIFLTRINASFLSSICNTFFIF